MAITNAIYESTSPSVVTGSVDNGDIDNITNSNFSSNCRINTSANIVNISVGAVTADYVALHGLKFANAPRGTTITVTLRDGVTTVETFNLNSGFSDVFINIAQRTFTDLRVGFSGSAFGSVTVSYFAAGLATEVPHGGLNPGQVLPYLQYNYKTRGSLNTNGQPIQQRRRKVSATVNVNLPKVTAAWVRDDLKRVFDLFAQTGVVSMLDFESEDYPTESWAAFNLKQTRATAFSGTRLLIPVSLTFSASPDYGYY